MKLLTRDEARAALGEMPKRTFEMWCSRGLPRRVKGKEIRYPWPEIFHWVMKQKEQQGRDSARPQSIDEARERKAAAEAELAELELAEKKGQLMTLETFRRAVADANARLDAQISTAPNKYAPRLVGVGTITDAKERLQHIFDEVRGHLHGAKDIPTAADDDDD